VVVGCTFRLLSIDVMWWGRSELLPRTEFGCVSELGVGIGMLRLLIGISMVMKTFFCCCRTE
jgi:hypothetical protein